ncbi:tRNAPhe (7-(3-amino-3-carboxypropyl)wyosine37-C2)-hydroxylase [Aureococcus anophagefferens]|uniref:tRNAPhe (7-(3-amino-3-carboxypropyl)wyosine37-C2)-hydroxylase n=1 Tax=Aureococcus anophagefferens TaxID=44056 RepID=A0ABR1G1J7_AURAN
MAAIEATTPTEAAMLRVDARAARATADEAMLALDRRAGRAAVEIASLFDLAGDAARFARPGNRGVYVVDLDMRGRANARFAAADEEATSPTEGGGPLALPVAGYCAAARRRRAAAGTLRRVASIAAQRCCRTAEARRAAAAMAMAPETPLAALKCFAQFASRGIAPKHWNPPVPAAVAALPATGDGFGDFVKRHEPCVVRGWGLEGPYAALLEKFGDDAYLKERCGSREVPTRGSWIDVLSGERVFASAANGSATLAEILDQRRTERVPTRYAAKIDLARTLPELAADLAAAEARSPRAAFGHWFGDAQPVHAYVAPGGAATATHVDPAEQLLLVVGGAKAVRLFAPGAAAALKPSNAPLFSVAALATVGPHAPFSAAPPAPFVDVALAAGDVLYLPAFWWHAVSSDGPSTILNFWLDPHEAKQGAPA